MKASYLLLLCMLFVCPPRSAAAPSGDNTKPSKDDTGAIKACAEMALSGFRKIADTRDQRFQGKVTEATAVCRGGQKTFSSGTTPWVDWSELLGHGRLIFAAFRAFFLPRLRGADGVSGALLDLEYQRIELIKFNLFDNNGTYQAYVIGTRRRRRSGAESVAGDAPAARTIRTIGRSAATANKFAKAI